jgi:hypothetical protein
MTTTSVIICVHWLLVSIEYLSNALANQSGFSVAYGHWPQEGSFQWPEPLLIQDSYHSSHTGIPLLRLHYLRNAWPFNSPGRVLWSRVVRLCRHLYHCSLVSKAHFVATGAIDLKLCTYVPLGQITSYAKCHKFSVWSISPHGHYGVKTKNRKWTLIL